MRRRMKGESRTKLMLCAIHSSIHQSRTVSGAAKSNCKTQRSQKDTTSPPSPSLFPSLLSSPLSSCAADAASKHSSRVPSDFMSSVSQPLSSFFPLLDHSSSLSFSSSKTINNHLTAGYQISYGRQRCEGESIHSAVSIF